MDSLEAVIAIVRNLVKSYKIKVTNRSIEELRFKIKKCNLATIANILNEFNVETKAGKLLQLGVNIPVPFITQFHNDPSRYIIVTEIRENLIFYRDNFNKKRSATYRDFELQWTQICIFLQGLAGAKEKNFEVKNAIEKRAYIHRLLYNFIPIAVYVSIVLLDKDNLPYQFYWIFTISSLGFWLIGLQLNRHNGRGSKLSEYFACSANNNNCVSFSYKFNLGILGRVSISEIGMVFFLGSLIALFISAIFNNFDASVLLLMTILTIPFIVFSVYLQAFRFKVWCQICLMIITILIIQLVLLSLVSSLQLKLSMVILYLTSFMGVFIIYKMYKYSSDRSQLINYLRASTAFFKDRFDIFLHVLNSSRRIDCPVDASDIIIGNRDAKNEIIFVSSFSCSACSDLFLIIEELLEKHSQMKVIWKFYLLERDKGKSFNEIQQILQAAIVAPEQSRELMRKLFLERNAFSSVKSSEHNFTEANALLSRHKIFCESNDLMEFPTIILNNQVVPPIYSANEMGTHLNFMLSSN